MECSRANEYIMRYMDNTLIEADAKALNKHLQACDACKEDFMAYDEIMNEFAVMDVVNAPEGFEDKVMDRIRVIPVEANKMANAIDNLLCTVWGTISVLFGIGFLLAINRDIIFEYFAGNEALARYLDMLTPVSVAVDRFIENFLSIAAVAASSASGYLMASRYVLLVVLSVLATVQYFIYRKNKVEA